MCAVKDLLASVSGVKGARSSNKTTAASLKQLKNVSV